MNLQVISVGLGEYMDGETVSGFCEKDPGDIKPTIGVDGLQDLVDRSPGSRSVVDSSENGSDVSDRIQLMSELGATALVIGADTLLYVTNLLARHSPVLVVHLGKAVLGVVNSKFIKK